MEPELQESSYIRVVAGELFEVRRLDVGWQARSQASDGGEWREARSIAFALIKARQYTGTPEAFGIAARDAEIAILRGAQ